MQFQLPWVYRRVSNDLVVHVSRLYRRSPWKNALWRTHGCVLNVPFYDFNFFFYHVSFLCIFVFFSLYLIAFIFSSCSFFFLLSPYSPALAHQMSSLTFFFLMLFLSPHVRGILLFIFVFFCLSFTQYFEYLSPIWYILLYLFDPEANSEGGDSSQW